MEEALQHVEAAKKERDIARDLAASLLKEQAGFKQQVQDLSHAAHPEVTHVSVSLIIVLFAIALHCLAFAVLSTNVGQRPMHPVLSASRYYACTRTVTASYHIQKARFQTEL